MLRLYLRKQLQNLCVSNLPHRIWAGGLPAKRLDALKLSLLLHFHMLLQLNTRIPRRGGIRSHRLRNLRGLRRSQLCRALRNRRIRRHPSRLSLRLSRRLSNRSCGDKGRDLWGFVGHCLLLPLRLLGRQGFRFLLVTRLLGGPGILLPLCLLGRQCLLILARLLGRQGFLGLKLGSLLGGSLMGGGLLGGGVLGGGGLLGGGAL